MNPPSIPTAGKSLKRRTASTAPVGRTIRLQACATCSSKPSTFDATAAPAASASSAKCALPAPPFDRASSSVSS